MVSVVVSLSSHAEEHEFNASKFWQDVVHPGTLPEDFRKMNGHKELSVMILLPFKARNSRHWKQIQKEILS